VSQSSTASITAVASAIARGASSAGTLSASASAAQLCSARISRPASGGATSQASGAGHGVQDVRRQIVETGDVDVMISIRSNFFYTRTVPCELWHFDRGKPAERRDQTAELPGTAWLARVLKA